MDEIGLEPACHLGNIPEEIALFQEKIAKIPELGSWAGSGCRFGPQCSEKDASVPLGDGCKMCGATFHHLCSTEHLILKDFIGDIGMSRACFDCALLAGLVQKKLAPQLVMPYYDQLKDWKGARVTPLTLGALLVTKSLRLSAACILAKRSRLVGVSAKCKLGKKCKDDGRLLACCFCASFYHNTAACLGVENVLPTSLLTDGPSCGRARPASTRARSCVRSRFFSRCASLSAAAGVERAQFRSSDL